MGETGRELGTRVKEHIVSWTKRDGKSAFGEKAHRTCTPAFDEVELLARENKPGIRRLREAIHIKAHSLKGPVILTPEIEGLNRRTEKDIKTWLPALAAIT